MPRLVKATARLPADVLSDRSTAVQPLICTSGENSFPLFKHRLWSGVSCCAVTGKTARASGAKLRCKIRFRRLNMIFDMGFNLPEVTTAPASCAFQLAVDPDCFAT